jgi:uncharacterized membrane protein
MNLIVCFLGIIIILGAVVIVVANSKTETVLNPAHEDWERAKMLQEVYQGTPYESNSTLGPEPPHFLSYTTYPYSTIGAIVFLIGFVTLVIGFAIPEE